jgi:hypothetical protein
MDAKHRSVQILGFLAVFAGVLYGLFALAAFFDGALSNIWQLLTRLLNLALGAYLVWAGIRMFRWAKGMPSLQTGRIKWGRVLLGALFAFNAMKALLHPPASAADIDVPLNKVQGQAIVAIYIAVAILGAALAISGIVAGFRSPAQSEERAGNRSRVG